MYVHKTVMNGLNKKSLINSLVWFQFTKIIGFMIYASVFIDDLSYDLQFSIKERVKLFDLYN